MPFVRAVSPLSNHCSGSQSPSILPFIKETQDFGIYFPRSVWPLLQSSYSR